MIHLNAETTLPLEAVTETFAIVGKRGMGKTSTAVVLTEEMVTAGALVVVLDPIGVWWGLRRAGTGEGRPVLVLGGDHGDIPLEPGAGSLVASTVVEARHPMVLDLSTFSKNQQRAFVTAFAEELYRLNRLPIHVVLDEADTFAPQRTAPGDERMLGAVDALWRRGRARGIGGTLITQRPAVVNKNLLSQSEVLITHRITTPHDRKAIADWVEANATDPAQAKEMLSSLSSLEVGEAWVWSPGWLELWKRLRIRPRETFDSSSTPRPGAAAARPGKAAPVDLDALRERMAELMQTKATDDSGLLRQRIEQLEKKLAEKAPAPPPAPLLNEEDRSLLRAIRGEIAQLDGRLIAALQIADGADSLEEFTRPVSLVIPLPDPPPPPPYRLTKPKADQKATGTSLAGGERKILTALAQYPAGRSKVQIAILTGYAVNGGGFANYLGAMKSKGLIAGSSDLFKATPEGLKALGSYQKLPTGKALLENWLARLGRCERLALSELASAFPKAMSKEQLAQRTGYEAGGGGFSNALGKLRTLELIVGGNAQMRASEALV